MKETKKPDYSQEEARAYKLQRLGWSTANTILQMAFLLWFYFSGFSEKFANYFFNRFDHWIVQLVLFVATYHIISYILGFAFSYKLTFSIEHKFGFSMQTKADC